VTEVQNQKKKLRVGVFFGGKSAEKEVSLATGRYVLNLLDSSKYEAIPLYMSYSGLIWRLPPKLVLQNTTKDVEEKLEASAQHIRFEDLPTIIDFAFIALLGKFGEDGAIQGVLDLVKIPYSGSGILASAVCMHKGVHKRFLRINNITVAEDIPLYRVDYKTTRSIESIIEEINNRFGFPVIVKPVAEGSSIGVSSVRSADKLADALDEAFKWDDELLIEEFITGQEFMCVVVGGEEPVAMLPSEVEFAGDIFTYENKYMPGQAVYHTPIRAPQEKIKEIQDIAVKVYRMLNIQGYGRVDGFLKNKETVYISEPHTGTIMVPSSYVFQQASLQDIPVKAKGGIKGKGGAKFNPRTFISTIIDLGMAAHAEKLEGEHD
jgi:D-alanine-D-alanine ligase